MKLLRPLLLLLTLAVLAAVPVAAHATDSHAPKGARGDWLPSDEWAMSQWLPYDEVTLDHLLRTTRDELAAWRDDPRTLGQLARKRGFRSQRALAKRLVAARGGHMSPALRRTLERRALDTLTQAHLPRPRAAGPPRPPCPVSHLPHARPDHRRAPGLGRELRALQAAAQPRPLAAPHRRRRPPLRGPASRVAAVAVRRARPPRRACRGDERAPGPHVAGRAEGHGRRLHAPALPDDQPAARLRHARVPPAGGALNHGAPGRPPRMSDQQDDDATPTEDPRQTGMADQMPEENPEGQGAGTGERQGPESGAGGADAPDPSRDSGPEDDPGRATGNPNAAG